MTHRPYNIYRRPTTKKAKFIYYCQFYDESGRRMNAMSTGQTSRVAAELWALEQLKRGIIPSDKNITFEKYVKTEKFWNFDECQYVKRKQARGSFISRGYVDSMQTYLTQHILPYFDSRKLNSISTRMIDNWILELKDKRAKGGKFLSPTSINHVLKTMKIMMREAKRLGYIFADPTETVSRLRETPRTRNILSIDEVRELFKSENLERVWSRDLRHFAINLLAATSGMRMGEIQALMIKNVHPDYVSVQHSWSRKYGLGPPKWDSRREIPIPRKTSTCLEEVVSTSPYRDPEDFVFFGETGKVPVRNELVLSRFYKALEAIGVPAEARRSRNISFHSWRHWYNSILRGRVHDAKLRRLTGHKTLKMTEVYTHFSVEDFKDVVKIQDEFFESKGEIS